MSNYTKQTFRWEGGQCMGVQTSNWRRRVLGYEKNRSFLKIQTGHMTVTTPMGTKYHSQSNTSHGQAVYKI